MEERERSTESNSPSLNIGEYFAGTESLVFGSFGGPPSASAYGIISQRLKLSISCLVIIPRREAAKGYLA